MSDRNTLDGIAEGEEIVSTTTQTSDSSQSVEFNLTGYDQRDEMRGNIDPLDAGMGSPSLDLVADPIVREPTAWVVPEYGMSNDLDVILKSSKKIAMTDTGDGFLLYSVEDVPFVDAVRADGKPYADEFTFLYKLSKDYDVAEGIAILHSGKLSYAPTVNQHVSTLCRDVKDEDGNSDSNLANVKHSQYLGRIADKLGDGLSHFVGLPDEARSDHYGLEIMTLSVLDTERDRFKAGEMTKGELSLFYGITAKPASTELPAVRTNFF